MSASMVGPFVILQVATVIAIVMFLRVLLHKQLEVGLKRIKKIDQENLKKEMGLNEKLAKLDKEYVEKIESAEKQADLLLRMAKEDGKRIREEDREKAKEEARKIIASALQEKERVRNLVKSEIREKAVDFAVDLVKRVFSNKEMMDIKTKSVKKAILDLMEAKNVTTLIIKNKKIEIITADKFSQKDKDQIRGYIEKGCGEKIDVKFGVGEDIWGGFILKTGESIIDGTLMTKVLDAAKEVKEEG
ncbi:MAG: F0F1 ATP synthase subunit delta [Candidatus Omnitrophica bacterium]|nr:F0F1 ATP synthase subunit delta [Candidatus Omnitrophota bacterium]